jgi:transcriptional regulator with XRE-family HTH domain
MSKTFFQQFVENMPPLTKKLVSRQMDFSVKVTDLIKLTGITQRGLAEKLGKKESFISRILSGNANPTLKTIVELELALGKDIIDFHMELKGHKYIGILYSQNPWEKISPKEYGSATKTVVSSENNTIDWEKTAA